MEKILDKSTTISSTIVDITDPEQLIQLGQKLLQAKQITLPGQEILLPLTRTITIRYNPEIPLSTYRSPEAFVVPAREYVASPLDMCEEDLQH